jgi:hypothetical protein
LFAETAGNLFDFAESHRRHRAFCRPNVHNLISKAGWLILPLCEFICKFLLLLTDLKLRDEIQKRVCVGVLSQRVCALSTLWGKDGWPCIIFYSCICTGGEITVSSWTGRHNDIRVWGHL